MDLAQAMDDIDGAIAEVKAGVEACDSEIEKLKAVYESFLPPAPATKAGAAAAADNDGGAVRTCGVDHIVVCAVEWLLTSVVLCLQGEAKEGGDDAVDEAGASDDAEAPSVPRTLPLLSEDELGRAKKVRAGGAKQPACCTHTTAVTSSPSHPGFLAERSRHAGGTARRAASRGEHGRH